MIEKRLKRDFRIRYLWSFGENTLVHPILDMEDLWTENIESAVQQGWAYSVWLDILNTQMKKASEFKMNFRGSIEVKTYI